MDKNKQNIMSEDFLKTEADRLIKVEGNLRGDAFLVHASYIRSKKGEEGLKKVEDKLKELGYPLSFKDIKPMGWYPEALSVLVVIIARDIFKWGDKGVFEMGNTAPQYSFIVKILLRYFLSPKKSFEETPKYWREHYDFGELEAHEFNEKEKYFIVRVKGHKFDPVSCVYHRGYFLKVAQYMIKSEKITIEETKCVYRGDDFHEYVVRWI